MTLPKKLCNRLPLAVSNLFAGVRMIRTPVGRNCKPWHAGPGRCCSMMTICCIRDYLRDVSAALARNPDATVGVSAMRVSQHPERADGRQVRGSRYVALTGRQIGRAFVRWISDAILLGGLPDRRAAASKFQFETYGKICDRPFVIEAALAGSAVVMLDPYVKYRIHAKQDSTDQATGPFLAGSLRAATLLP